MAGGGSLSRPDGIALSPRRSPSPCSQGLAMRLLLSAVCLWALTTPARAEHPFAPPEVAWPLPDAALPGPRVEGLVLSAGLISEFPKLPFCGRQNPILMPAEKGTATPDCGLAGPQSSDAATEEVSRSTARFRRASDATELTNLRESLKQRESQLQELQQRVDLHSETLKHQADIVLMIREWLRRLGVGAQPTGKPENTGAADPPAKDNAVRIRRASHSNSSNAASTVAPPPPPKCETCEEGAGSSSIQFVHPARIVSVDPSQSTYEALIYEGMSLQVFDDGTYRLKYIIETPNTDVTMRMQFQVLWQPDGEELQVLPLTITPPPVKFSRERNGVPAGDRLFWTVSQTGYSPYFLPKNRRNSMSLVRAARAEFGSVPDRPDY